MLQAVFGGLLGLSLLYGLARGKGGEVMNAVLAAAGEGVQTALLLAGGFAFFCGMIAIPRRAGAVGWLAKKCAPALRRLLGRDVTDEAMDCVTMNLTANLLGLGNAATPMGIEAARRMADGAAAGNALCLFLVINSSSVQLLPTTVIALRAAAGSGSPGSITLPALAATCVSTLVGVISCKAMEKWT